jgi:hypothetical protein
MNKIVLLLVIVVFFYILQQQNKFIEPLLVNDEPLLVNDEPLLVNDKPLLVNDEPRSPASTPTSPQPPSLPPSVIGIAVPNNSIGINVSSVDLKNTAWCRNNSNNICTAEYRLAFSNGSVSNITIKYDSKKRLFGTSVILKNPDVLFALSNIPQEGITVKLQGKNVSENSNDNNWYDMDVPPQFIKPPQTTVKFSGNTSTPILIFQHLYKNNIFVKK